MQKLAVQGGGIETGVMLDYIPAGTRYREIVEQADHRRAVVVVYQPLAAAPARDAFLPERYAPLIVPLWDRAELRRLPLAPASSMPAVPTRLESTLDTHRGLLRIEGERRRGPARSRGEAADGLAQMSFRSICSSDSAHRVRRSRCAARAFFFRSSSSIATAAPPQRLPDERAGRSPPAGTARGRELPDVIARIGVIREPARARSVIISGVEQVGQAEAVPVRGVPVSPAAIIYPAIAMFFLTFGILVNLGVQRYAAIRRREVSIRYYRLYTEGQQPDRLQLLGRHVQNHFEVPPLFHIAVLLSDPSRDAAGGGARLALLPAALPALLYPSRNEQREPPLHGVRDERLRAGRAVAVSPGVSRPVSDRAVLLRERFDAIPG
jgi:hypothetical protein